MKIINATWERRNFGMDAFEISVEKKDLKDHDEIFRRINEQNFKNAYVLIKIPVGDIKLVHALEDAGFRFLETQFTLTSHFTPRAEDLEMAEMIDSVATVTETILKDKDEWEKIIQKITVGMFDTDRVSLDPALGLDVSCKRYQNWCRDLFNNPNSVMHVTKLNDDIIGFGIDILNETTGNYEGVLGGMFENAKNGVYGANWITQPFVKMKTSVSSNNLPVLRIHQFCGRIVSKERYVLRKIYD